VPGQGTEFTFSSHPAPHAPEALWSDLHLAAAPGAGTPAIQVGGTYLGAVGDAGAQLERLYAAAGSIPSERFVKSMSYMHAMLVEAGCADLDVQKCGRVSRQPQYAKSDFFTRPLSSAAIGTLLRGMEKLRGVRGARGGSGGVAFDALGGAVNGIAPQATAFIHRNALFIAQYLTDWTEGASAPGIGNQYAWLRSLWRSMRPYASGQAYQNYIDPDLAGWRQAYYGANYPRLVNVKHTYDPGRLFSFPQAI
jgi:hypothetical protein